MTLGRLGQAWPLRRGRALRVLKVTPSARAVVECLSRKEVRLGRNPKGLTELLFRPRQADKIVVVEQRVFRRSSGIFPEITSYPR